MASYKIRTPQISHETIDGETVIINLDNGNYYSIDGVGADIWNLIDSGANINQISELISENYNIDKDEVHKSIEELTNELISEGLIVNSKNNEKFDKAAINLVSLENNKNPEYKKPSLEKYTDMQDLLLLDPIHEVDDESGWPTPKDSESD